MFTFVTRNIHRFSTDFDWLKWKRVTRSSSRPYCVSSFSNVDECRLNHIGRATDESPLRGYDCPHLLRGCKFTLLLLLGKNERERRKKKKNKFFSLLLHVYASVIRLLGRRRGILHDPSSSSPWRRHGNNK